MGRPPRILAVMAVMLSAGCQSERHVTDPDPCDKIPAIRVAAAQHDVSAIPSLIKDLDNDDPAVRLYAIEGLRTMTGKDFGYRYFDEDVERKPPIERWRKWYKSQPKPFARGPDSISEP